MKKNFCEDPFFFLESTCALCPWPRECLSSERLSLASDFFCVLGLEPCVLDSTSVNCLPLSIRCFENKFYNTAFCKPNYFTFYSVFWIFLFSSENNDKVNMLKFLHIRERFMQCFCIDFKLV